MVSSKATCDSFKNSLAAAKAAHSLPIPLTGKSMTAASKLFLYQSTSLQTRFIMKLVRYLPSNKMSSAIERPFIETRSHNDRPMKGFLWDRDEFSSGIAPNCLIGHRSADHRYRMSFASRYDRKPSSAVSWR
ncbi:hypothetical protein AVEN_23565-1 [Araneus ventricosus]|uniref:Uncharacterized protein n=1 Tax=Araneus ventricosus TaxID=182803 RepID=A0A4Y2L2Y1_ARAVE|nr:hypothetical protein AVEN_23565-1 [Araneus ventricosus]